MCSPAPEIRARPSARPRARAGSMVSTTARRPRALRRWPGRPRGSSCRRRRAHADHELVGSTNVPMLMRPLPEAAPPRARAPRHPADWPRGAASRAAPGSCPGAAPRWRVPESQPTRARAAHSEERRARRLLACVLDGEIGERASVRSAPSGAGSLQRLTIKRPSGSPISRWSFVTASQRFSDGHFLGGRHHGESRTVAGRPRARGCGPPRDGRARVKRGRGRTGHAQVLERVSRCPPRPPPWRPSAAVLELLQAELVPHLADGQELLQTGRRADEGSV